MVGFPRGDGKVSLLRGEVECHGRIREKSMVEVGGSGMPCGPVMRTSRVGSINPTARTNPTGGISPCKG